MVSWLYRPRKNPQGVTHWLCSPTCYEAHEALHNTWELANTTPLPWFQKGRISACLYCAWCGDRLSLETAGRPEPACFIHGYDCPACDMLQAECVLSTVREWFLQNAATRLSDRQLTALIQTLLFSNPDREDLMELLTTTRNAGA